MQPGGMGGPPGGPGWGGPPGGAPPAGYPGAPQAGGYPGAPQAGGHPAAPQAGGYPAAPQAGGFPGAPQAGGFPGAPQAGGFPGAPQAGGYPGAPQPGMPQAMGMQPGMGAPQPGAPNPYGRAQAALKQGSNMMTYTKWGLIGGGGLFALIGLIVMITSSIGAGIGLLVTGAIMVGTAFLVLPQFTGMMSQATAQVDGLAQKAQLAQTGIPMMGRLVHVQQTGRMVNFNPEIAATVEVQHPQMGAYQVQTTAVVPQMSIPQVQPGAQVQVRVNPANPQDIALVV